MSISIALFQPEIAQNTGSLIRLTTCLATKLHIIHPTGFEFSDRGIKRAGLDYIVKKNIIEHDSFEEFEKWREQQNKRLILLTTKAKQSPYEISFKRNDIILLGRESSGVPDYVAQKADINIRIPMAEQMRSLNVAIAGSLVLAEAMRQTGGFLDLT